MTLQELHNRDWGFESNCFVCEPSNARGLQIPFAYDAERDLVVAELNLDGAFSGAPEYAHGGVVLAVLDEAMAWACIAVAHRFAVTQETATRFERGVRIGRSHRLEAAVSERSEDAIHATAVICDDRDRVCATAGATFVPLGEAQATRVIGERPTDTAASYVERGR